MKTKLEGDVLELILEENLVASNLDKQNEQTKTALEEHSTISALTLNLENVQEIDSLGINLVVGLYKELSNRNKKFSIINASQAIKNLFNLFKLDSYFEIN